MALNPASNRVTRRVFMRAAMGSVGALAAGGATVLGPARTVAAGKPAGNVIRNPLHIPPTASPSGLSLVATPAQVDLGGGNLSSVLAYNGLFPGPTVIANTGYSASIMLTNGLPDDTTIHWHGMIVPTPADGHPKDAVAPGGGYLYEFPIVQRACMNWYHPHPHMLTGEQICLALAGAFFVRDAEEAALGLPSGAYEVPLNVRDANTDRAGNLVYNPRSSGFVGRLPLVNGTRDARLDVDTALYRLRVLNGANARIFRLALSNGAPFTLIGNDGGLLPAAIQLTETEIAPAERLDLVVDFRGLPVGTSVMLQCRDAGWDLLEFFIARQVSAGGSVPTGSLSTILPLPTPVRTREFSFDGMSRINGQEYALTRIDFQVPFGDTERWRFMTGGNAPHPVHVHGASFQVESRRGGRGQLFPWEGGWKDTVLLQDGETVDVRVRFDRYRGEYLLHCHKLEHEDQGMMANFEVI